MATVTIDAGELENLQIDAAIGALALHLADERRRGEDRRREDRGTPDRRRLSLEEARELWDRH